MALIDRSTDESFQTFATGGATALRPFFRGRPSPAASWLPSRFLRPVPGEPSPPPRTRGERVARCCPAVGASFRARKLFRLCFPPADACKPAQVTQSDGMEWNGTLCVPHAPRVRGALRAALDALGEPFLLLARPVCEPTTCAAASPAPSSAAVAACLRRPFGPFGLRVRPEVGHTERQTSEGAKPVREGPLAAPGRRSRKTHASPRRRGRISRGATALATGPASSSALVGTHREPPALLALVAARCFVLLDVPAALGRDNDSPASTAFSVEALAAE